MAVSIRLSRIGKKHVPFYRIVVMDSRKKVTGAFLENLGTYDALNTKLVQFNLEGMEAWEKKGAIPSDTVKKLKKLYKAQLAGEVLVKDKSKGIMAAPKKVVETPKEEAPVEAIPEAKTEAPKTPVKEVKAEEKPAKEASKK